jgi:hypothetical protein
MRAAPRWIRAALCATACLVVAAGAAAQDPHGEMAGSTADVPAGDGTLRVQVVHPGNPEAAAGLDVALYALSPDGSPGLRSGRTGEDGSVSFTGISTASDVVYLVGARYRDIPFGRRATFSPGNRQLDVEIEVNDPITDTGDIHVRQSEWRLQWLGAELWVHETHTLESSADRVVQVPEALRATARPAFEGALPEGATGFTPALGSFSQGLDLDGATLRFWGPVYPGSQEVRYRYRLPATNAGDGARLVLQGIWPSGTGDLTLSWPESGLEVETPGRALEPAETVEVEGQPHRVVEVGALAPGDRVDLAIVVPAASHDLSRLSITRADLWMDLDDVAAVVSQEVRLQVTDGQRLAGSPDAPLLRFTLPPGAQLLGASQNAAAIGLGAADTDSGPALDLVGPLAPGDTAFGFRYRLPVTDPDGPLRWPLQFPAKVAVVHVLIADTGLLVEDERLHRMRPVRSGTRTYLHREGFHIEADEPIELRISRIERPGTPLWASLGGTLVLGVLGAGFLLQPLRRGPRAESGRDEAVESPLVRERQEVIESLRDLEHDHETGKIADADYEGLRASLRGRALELMRLERRGADTSGAAEPAEPATGAAAFCPSCGARSEPGWRFCAGCGAALPSADRVGTPPAGPEA